MNDRDRRTPVNSVFPLSFLLAISFVSVSFELSEETLSVPRVRALRGLAVNLDALRRPMLTDIGAWVVGCPTIEHGGQGMSLGASGRQVPSEDAHQYQVRLRGEVGHILCDHDPFLGSRGGADFGVRHTRQPDLAYMHRLMAELVPQALGGFGREHLVEEEFHPRSDRRRSVLSRAASIASSLRAI